jgi:uncharacterized protein YlxW (UPF0749 family)
MRNTQRFNFTEGFDGFGVPDALPQLPISLTYQDRAVEFSAEFPMTLTTEDTQDNQQQILTELRELKKEVEQFNQKFDNYQKATQWVVQLAFSLIAAATVTVIVSTVLGK